MFCCANLGNAIIYYFIPCYMVLKNLPHNINNGDDNNQYNE